MSTAHYKRPTGEREEHYRARLAQLRELKAKVDAEVAHIEFLLSLPKSGRRKRAKELPHGTENGYGWHRRKGIPFPEDEGGEPCGCRAAHSMYVRNQYRRGVGRKPRKGAAA